MRGKEILKIITAVSNYVFLSHIFFNKNRIFPRNGRLEKNFAKYKVSFGSEIKFLQKNGCLTGQEIRRSTEENLDTRYFEFTNFKAFPKFGCTKKLLKTK